ncbi:putative nuclear pore protein 84 / 107 [Lyophyllum shimeji]|uniref:Nuclear pore complex protein n=1 Tax=Lyophyllum shimeji TaxID=47721 RepID=A0A9P3PM72_LYOSH|nr:putative nuclear pore protein 84 / 107 [Lyophyllum shimeji]
MSSEALYVSCAEVLSLCQSKKDDLAALLDPETGFAPQLRKICQQQLAEYEETRDVGTTQQELDLLRMEENTWALLQAVMPARKTEPLPLANPRDLLAENPYTPTSTVAQAIMNASRLLTELVVVREWLHETAPLPQPPEATTGYWKFTKHSVMQSLRTGAGHRDGLVKRMDPDAVNREQGRGLASDDANYEKSLVQALCGYVRAGRLEEAIDLCRKANQPWRAASIRGSRLFQWRAISTEPQEEEVMDGDDNEVWSGNRHRKLWKAACTRAALSVTLPDHERTLYAALAPSPQTSVILKSSCRTWEDHLWAQISIMCEEKETMEMTKLGGGFWEGGLTAVEQGVPEITQEEQEKEEVDWEKEVTETLTSLENIPVAEGPGADHPFHYSQLHIILNQTDQLLDTFAMKLRSGTFLPSSPEYAPLCRFFAHLCLFLQMIEIAVPPLATQVILEAYLQVLEAAGQRDLIAMYAGALGDNAVERYAMFLVSLELSADTTERRLALTRARDHGLDMDRVAIAAAERTIDSAFEMLPPLKGPLPSIIALQPPPTDAELFLLRSIEWTTYNETTYPTALEQANVILRYFLGSGRVQLAQTLLGMLPAELAAIGEPEEQATEYLHYRQFFIIWETLDRVVQSQALEIAHMNRETRLAWLTDYRGLIDQAHDQITKLLTSEWLVTDVEKPGGDRRRRELIRIRQMYIPELIIRLHSLLFNSRHHIPENLKRALELANVVADSRYKLYEDFVNEDGRRLGDYLGAVRQAVLGDMYYSGIEQHSQSSATGLRDFRIPYAYCVHLLVAAAPLHKYRE